MYCALHLGLIMICDQIVSLPRQKKDYQYFHFCLVEVQEEEAGCSAEHSQLSYPVTADSAADRHLEC
jgi:hypothetical protein